MPTAVRKRNTAETATIVGDKFESGEYYLPHLVLAGNAIEAATKVLQSAVPEGDLEEKKVIVIGTVEGDMHSLGKNIVAMMLRATGFEVHDLGIDVGGRGRDARGLSDLGQCPVVVGEIPAVPEDDRVGGDPQHARAKLGFGPGHDGDNHDHHHHPHGHSGRGEKGDEGDERVFLPGSQVAVADEIFIGHA